VKIDIALSIIPELCSLFFLIDYERSFSSEKSYQITMESVSGTFNSFDCEI
jgi:hypothetical protein